MRAHGIKNFPDPSAGGGINISGGQGTRLDPASPQFQAADKTCKSLMPGSALSPAQQAQVKAGNLKYAQCMRAHGDLRLPRPDQPGPDPDPGQAGQRPGPEQPALSVREQGLPAIPARRRQGRVAEYQRQWFRRWGRSAVTPQAEAAMAVAAEPGAGAAI